MATVFYHHKIMKMTYRKIRYIYWAVYGILMVAPSGLSFATSGDGCGGTSLCNPLGGSGITDLPTFLQKILGIVIELGAIVVVFFIIYAGFKYVTAGGDEGKIAKAHQMLLWTVVGAAILLGAQVLATAISGTIKELGIGN